MSITGKPAAPIDRDNSHVATFGGGYYGRDVAVRIDPPEADPGIGQFKVSLLVDGKVRYVTNGGGRIPRDGEQVEEANGAF